MPKICDFRSADRCGFLENDLSPCQDCPFGKTEDVSQIGTGPQGEAGSEGPKGDTGPPGPPGRQGDAGQPGSMGPVGLTGSSGIDGRVGPPGPKGDKGDEGDEGPEGTVDEELLKRLIKAQLRNTQRGQAILGWGSRRGAPPLTLVTKTANYTVTGSDNVILCNAAAGAFTVTLPTAVGRDGKVYHTKKIDSSGNPVTVGGNASETIDGDTTKVINIQYDSMMIISDGSNWHIV